MRVRNTLLLAAALGGGLVLSAAGQTGRIALASHSGNVSELVEADDNLGLHYSTYWKADTLVYLNDSTVLHKGLYSRSYHGPPIGEASWQRRIEEEGLNGYYQKISPQASLDALRDEYPNATFIGFDKLGKHSKRKMPKGAQMFPKRPFQYSHWRGLATVAALGAMGWLLGRKAKTA